MKNFLIWASIVCFFPSLAALACGQTVNVGLSCGEFILFHTFMRKIIQIYLEVLAEAQNGMPVFFMRLSNVWERFFKLTVWKAGSPWPVVPLNYPLVMVIWSHHRMDSIILGAHRKGGRSHMVRKEGRDSQEPSLPFYNTYSPDPWLHVISINPFQWCPHDIIAPHWAAPLQYPHSGTNISAQETLRDTHKP